MRTDARRQPGCSTLAAMRARYFQLWRRQVLVAAVIGTGLLTGAAGPGCGKPLLSPDEERSPFDRYDGIRAQYSPQFTTDEYGMRKPNLRARLTPKN